MASPTPTQVCMTLSGLAPTGSTPRPSGEALAQQTARILAGIAQQLRDTALATRGVWEVAWLALSPDNANLAYVARSTDGSNRFAAVVRGTIGSLADIMEDLDAGVVVPFTASGSPTPVAVSKGAMTAFCEIAAMVSIPLPSGDALGAPVPQSGLAAPGTTLAQALAELLHEAPSTPKPTVYVTGHSLGGCIATMLAPYLLTQARSWTNVPAFALETFAAPTAGLQSFASYLNGLPWLSNNHNVNAWDVIPLAWASLKEVKQDKWYPSPGPAGNTAVHVLFDELGALSKGNVYVQPGVRQQFPADGDYSTYDSALVNSTLADFLGQVAFQHANNTYLGLLGATPLPAGPIVTSVSPAFGESGDTVTINGSGFTLGTVVDFGTVPCDTFTTTQDGTRISAMVPEGVGIVDVRVTNALGTSPAAPLGQFAYGGPAPMVVTAVKPTRGRVGTAVTISGAGFPTGAAASGATVLFKDKPATKVVFVSATEITANAPQQLDDRETVDVTVRLGDITTATGPAGEFTYTGL